MANPRELAEQAFSLLQNALRDSEARASDLDEQLKRKKAPKTRLEEQLEVLGHRLESVEAERVRWQREAQNLEEIAEAERAKVAHLKKKLEIAESGPEKLTKKEINFWRAKAEDIDTETRDYKNRLAGLRKEIIERDSLIDQLRADPATAPAPAAALPDAQAPVAEPPGDTVEIDDLRWQLEQRDRRLTDLQVELNDLRDRQDGSVPAGDFSLEAQAQLETLKHQAASFEQALTEAHTARAAAKGDLSQAQQALAEQQRLAREAQAGFERARTTLGEREHRIMELSATLEQMRTELNQREQQWRETSSHRDEQIAALARDLEALRHRAENDRRDAADGQNEREQLRSALNDARQQSERLGNELGQLRNLVAQLEQTERNTAAANANLQGVVADREMQIADRDRQLADRDGQLAERDRRIADRDTQIGTRDQQLADQGQRLMANDQRIADYERDLDERARQIAERDQRFAAHEQTLNDHGRVLAERDQRLDELNRLLRERDQQLEDSQRAVRERDQQADDQQQLARERGEQLASLTLELAQARAMLEASSSELTSMRDTLLGSNRDLDQVRHHKHRLEAELSDVLTRADSASAAAAAKDQEIAQLTEHRQQLELQRDEVREQMAGLEAELKEEKEQSENLGALANERREAMTKLQEQAEDAEERYEETKWRLGKAQHFERLVKRRKGLVAKLLAALRAKAKANTALKAGLDGLRTYKAAAEVNQQKLLQRIDGLKNELREAEEAVERQQTSTSTKEQLADTQSRAAALETRVNTQAELIQSLEADLKVARTAQRSGDDKNHEIERLHKELDTKNHVITQLQGDLDEQQRRLAKLRGSESETMRLKAISEKERGSIESLEREITELRDQLAKQQSGAGAAPSGDLEAKLKEREGSVTRLMGTVKDHEATIKKLTESVESWKRKYQFLATDSPDAYKNVAEK